MHAHDDHDPHADDIPAVLCVDCAIWHANADATGLDTDAPDYVAVTTAPGVPNGYRVVVGGWEWSFTGNDTCDACERTGFGDLRTAWFV